MSLSDSLTALRDFYDSTAALMERSDDVMFAAVPTVSGWSVAEHLAHVWLANGRSLKAALYVVNGQGEPAPEGGNPQAEALLERGTLPRGRMEAPDSVAPPEDLDRETLKETLARSRRTFEDVAARAEDVAASEGVMPHPALGPLTAGQWVRFVRIHAEHHAAIVEEILAAQE